MTETPRTVWLQNLRWPEIEAHLKVDDVALIPIGATEQHGFHLPLSVDTGWAVTVSEEAARTTGAVVTPPLHFGWSPHHMGFPGTVTLGGDTLRRVSLDIARSLIHHGFRRLIFVNGNRIANLQPLELAAVELINTTGALVAVADAGLIARHEVKALCEADDGGLEHAGEAETSLALLWAGDHVAMDQAAVPPLSNAPANETGFDYPVELDPALDGNAVSRFMTPDALRMASSPAGSVGDPRPASVEKGRAMVAAVAANLARLIEQLRAAEVGQTHTDIPC
ncbi:MAG: creatininase family protein [Pseudomonadota bacterium]